IIRTDQNAVVVHKKVSLFSTGLSFLGGDPSGFTENDLQYLKDQSFIDEVAPFLSSQFQVTALSDALGFKTLLFFQALPPAFVDIDPDLFYWKKGMEEIPIVLSYDYLALYNFAFAPSQGLPPITEGTIESVDFQHRLDGNGMFKVFEGRIAGFSRRINSILIPEEALSYLNGIFGEQKKRPTQVMLRVNNPFSKAFTDFLDENKLEVSRGLGDRLQGFVQIVFPTLALMGILIAGLALLIFVLNYRLIVAERKDAIGLLLQLGYHPKMIRKPVLMRFFFQLLFTFGLALIALFALQGIMVFWFGKQGFTLPLLPSWISIGLCGILSVSFWLAMQKNLKKVVR
ncbi:MAG: FtsX-like permease family protein, partial [Bacteroidota bacterium]